MTEPLAGLRVIVTRSESQASELSARLTALGATPVEIAMIRIAEPSDGGEGLRTAVGRLSTFDWVVMASPNGARSFDAAIGRLGRGAVDVPRVACVGPSTARVVSELGHRVDLVPDRHLAEGLVEQMPMPAGGERVLLVQAEVSRPVLEEGLANAGFEVERVAAYRTLDALVSDADRLDAAAADVVTFTSSSTVERFVRLVGRESLPRVVASIGPITSATARELGLAVDIEAPTHTLDGLVEALVEWTVARAG